MEAKKYGFSYYYGHGYAIDKDGYGHNYFTEKIRVYDRETQNYEEIRTNIKKFSLPIKEGTREYPLFLVSDGEEWFEFFTGEKVNIVDRMIRDNSFDLQNIDAKNCGYYQFTAFVDKCTPTEFAKVLNEIDDKQAKQLVSQFYEMQREAAEWQKRFANTIEEMWRENRNRKNGATEQIEKRMGQFKNAKLSEDTNIESNESKKESPLKTILLILIPIILLVIIFFLRGI